MFTALTVVYVLCQALTTLDTRMIQAVRAGNLPTDTVMLPYWIGYLIFVQWGVFVAMLIIDWKAALVVGLAVFVLRVLPVMELLGNVLASPIKRYGVPYNQRPL